MACYHPLTALVTGIRSDSGKKALHVLKANITPPKGVEFVKVPCGGCLGCREDRAKSWALRCVHESSLYKDNCFITLTYDDDHLPAKGSLVKSDFQLFMKRFRKRFGSGIRFYMCGEYGTQLGRPHYHACIFNFDFPMASEEFPDGKVFYKKTASGILYKCKALEDCWKLGYVTVGSVTFDSAAYVARYILKKINGEMAPGHYQGRCAEFTTMSRRPGIAKEWFNKFSQSDVELSYRTGFVVMNGRTYKIPKYYDSNFEILSPGVFADVKATRMEKAKASPDNTPQRLKDRETFHRARNDFYSTGQRNLS